jgi:hypothetical protein
MIRLNELGDDMKNKTDFAFVGCSERMWGGDCAIRCADLFTKDRFFGVMKITNPLYVCIMVRSSVSSFSYTRCIHFIGELLHNYPIDASRLLFVIFAYEESFLHKISSSIITKL